MEWFDLTTVSPAASLFQGTAFGGPAPEEMARMLGKAEARHQAAEDRQANRRARIAAARATLTAAVSELSKT
jgi:hypothetical protein